MSKDGEETLEDAKKRLDELKVIISSKNPAKGDIPTCIKVLKPSSDTDSAMVKYYSGKINKAVKDKFNLHATNGGFLQLEEEGATGSGTEVGKIWHRHLKDAIHNPNPNNPSQYDKAAYAVIDKLKSNGIVKDIKFLQTDFSLYGFMKDKESLEIYLWNGKADGIGWLKEKYVIVEWKAVDLLNFWEKDKYAYGKYLRQSLIYAKLLELHLDLPYLPEILIVPINNKSGKDIHPIIFHNLPEECTERLKDFEWSVNKPKISKMISKDLVNPNVPNQDLDNCKIKELFKDKDTTMRELLDELGLEFFNLTIED